MTEHINQMNLWWERCVIPYWNERGERYFIFERPDELKRLAKIQEQIREKTRIYAETE